LFLEQDYSQAEFYDFLERFEFDTQQLERFFDAMASYEEGLWTPEMLRFRGEIEPGTFWDVYCQLNGCLARLFPKDQIAFLGGKEILSEEYVPFLLSKGTKVIHVVRDPRAMICSADSLQLACVAAKCCHAARL